MSIDYTSEPKQSDKNGETVIIKSDYPKFENINPEIDVLSITTKTITDNLYNGKCNISLNNLYNFEIIFTINSIEVSKFGISFILVESSLLGLTQEGEFQFQTEITFIGNPDIYYTIKILLNKSNISKVKVNYKSALRFGVESTNNFNGLQISNNYNVLQMPIINILGQTLIDGSDIGNMIFTILDKYSYYKDTCNNGNIEQLKVTIFDMKCPKMISVVIGDAITLRAKIVNIWKIVHGDFNTLYKNIILYGMVRYILSKILYCNFDINYLLRKYYEQFLIDLEKSRFYNFLQFFEDPINAELFLYFK